MESLLPPLPVHEFEMLTDLAAGRGGWEGVVRRRGGREGGGGTMEGGWGRAGEEGGRGAMEEQGGQGAGRIHTGNPHHLTPRYMRRHWRRILIQCSTMHFDAVSNKWKVQWGQDSRGDELKRGEGLGGQEWMFEGVDEMGKRFGGPRDKNGDRIKVRERVSR